MKKNAFTLAEILIVMALIGVIAIILLPNTKTLVPNKSLTMYKKAHSVTAQIVSNLIDDEDLYPEKTTADDDFTSNLSNTDGAIYRSEERSGSSKFCWLFAEMLNVTSAIKCDDGKKNRFTDGTKPSGHFTTSDGIVWILPISEFTGNSDDYESIFIDINGDEGPNKFVKNDCTPYNDDGSSKCRGVEPDRFEMKINKDGVIKVDNPSIEKFYLKSESSTAKYYAGDKK